LWHKCKKLISKFQKGLSEKKKTRPSEVGLQAVASYEVKRCNMDTLKVWLGKNKLLVGGKKEQLIEKMVQAMEILFDQGARLSSCFQLPLSYP
jgi:hypothetical protein